MCIQTKCVSYTTLFRALGMCHPCGFWCPSFPLAWSDHGIHSPKSSADQQIARILVYPCFHVVFHPSEFCMSVSMFSSFPTKKHGDVLTGWVPVTSLKKAIQRQQMSQGLWPQIVGVPVRRTAAGLMVKELVGIRVGGVSWPHLIIRAPNNLVIPGIWQWFQVAIF